MNWINFVIQLLGMIGPELKAAIIKALDEWEVSAKETKGPVDDFIVALLKALIH